MAPWHPFCAIYEYHSHQFIAVAIWIKINQVFIAHVGSLPSHWWRASLSVEWQHALHMDRQAVARLM